MKAIKNKAEVIILPTNVKRRLPLQQRFIIGRIYQNHGRDILKILKSEEVQIQHLYLLSDRKIRQGDWYRVMDDAYNKSIAGSIAKADARHLLLIKDSKYTCKKIIATTDKSLEGVARLSQVFIEEYCELFSVNEVDVEYSHLCYQRDSLHDGFKGQWNEISIKAFEYSLTNPESLHHKYKEYKEEIKPKVNSNNEVVIHSIKDSWTREEVLDFANKVANLRVPTIKEKEEWIKENL